MIPLKYLQAHSASLQNQVHQPIAENRLGEYLERRYPGRHDAQSDKALHACIMNLKQEHLRSVPGLDKVFYDNKLDVVQCVLGLRTAISRMQGGKLRAKRGVRVTSLFKDVAPEFLWMIVVHELAHLKESEHNKAFYQLCRYMPPDYHQPEFDLRVYPTWKSL